MQRVSLLLHALDSLMLFFPILHYFSEIKNNRCVLWWFDTILIASKSMVVDRLLTIDRTFYCRWRIWKRRGGVGLQWQWKILMPPHSCSYLTSQFRIKIIFWFILRMNQNLKIIKNYMIHIIFHISKNRLLNI